MITPGEKIVCVGEVLNNSGVIRAPKLDLTFKRINGLEGMVHPGLQHARFTGVESKIDLSIFVRGAPNLITLQFVNCQGLECSRENFEAAATLLSRTNFTVSGGEFNNRYNEYIGTRQNLPAFTDQLAQQTVAFVDDQSPQMRAADRDVSAIGSPLGAHPVPDNTNSFGN